MESTYAQQYRNLYENHWWWRSRERYVLDIISNLGLPDNADILDVGCGDGLFFEALSKWGRPFGVEPDSDLIRNVKWREHIYNAPFDANLQLDRSFDLILMLDVLEHLDDDLSALRQAIQVLKPGGKVLATVPALMSAWTAHDQVNHHRRRYRKSPFETIMKSAGFEVTVCRYYFVWTYLPKFLLSLKERLMGESTSQAQTQIPSYRINSFITLMSYFEHRFLHHIPVPFGTSLIAVGEKM